MPAAAAASNRPWRSAVSAAAGVGTGCCFVAVVDVVDLVGAVVEVVVVDVVAVAVGGGGGVCGGGIESCRAAVAVGGDAERAVLGGEDGPGDVAAVVAVAI